MEIETEAQSEYTKGYNDALLDLQTFLMDRKYTIVAYPNHIDINTERGDININEVLNIDTYFNPSGLFESSKIVMCDGDLYILFRNNDSEE
jgi:hypothetical protein